MKFHRELSCWVILIKQVIDVAIVYALLSFVGTLYVAKLIRGDLE